VGIIPLIEPPVTEWYCPNCGLTDQTRQAGPHSRFHTCPKLRGLTAPMVQKGVAARVTAHDREDYVNGELVQVDGNGRPIMSINVQRDEGNDVVVFAPTARAVAGA
jgi:predicted RNA-binding Zn-ribbon protein involved in translation (DUF1610 family)